MNIKISAGPAQLSDISLSILTKYPLTAGSLDTRIDPFFQLLKPTPSSDGAQLLVPRG
jgi:hypothetical protein